MSTDKSGDQIRDRITALESQINELKARWPAHSVPATLMERLDELEDTLAAEKKKLSKHNALSG